jgi:hypothetical protein
VDFIPDELQEEDPLEVLGRFIAAKSKSLWRRASKGKQTGKVETRGVVSETTMDEERNPSRPPNCEQVLPSPSDPPDDARK